MYVSPLSAPSLHFRPDRRAAMQTGGVVAAAQSTVPWEHLEDLSVDSSHTQPAPSAGERAGQEHPWHPEGELSPQRTGPLQQVTSFATISCQKRKKIHKCVMAFDKGLPWPRAGGKFIFSQRSRGEGWLNYPVHRRVSENTLCVSKTLELIFSFFLLPFLFFFPSFLFLLTFMYYQMSCTLLNTLHILIHLILNIL